MPKQSGVKQKGSFYKSLPVAWGRGSPSSCSPPQSQQTLVRANPDHSLPQGTIEFAGILYLPGMAPFDQQQQQQRSRSIKLYVKRVFISDEFDDDLMPRYLNFVKVWMDVCGWMSGDT